MDITAWSFDDFCKQLQKAVQDGYSIDFESNQGYPQMIPPSVFIASVSKKGKDWDAILQRGFQEGASEASKEESKGKPQGRTKKS